MTDPELVLKKLAIVRDVLQNRLDDLLAFAEAMRSRILRDRS
jgi:hypothetical protein